MAFIFGPMVGVFFMWPLISLAITIWAVVDVASHTRVDVYSAGYNKTAWIVIIMLAGFVGLGGIPALFYLVGPRQKIRRVEARH